MIRDFLYKIFSKRKQVNINEEVNIVDSIVKAKELHKILIALIHPDKNPNNQHLAEEISSLLNANRFNYKELLKLKHRIEHEL